MKRYKVALLIEIESLAPNVASVLGDVIEMLNDTGYEAINCSVRVQEKDPMAIDYDRIPDTDER